MSEIKTEIIFDVLSNCRNLTDLTLKRTQFDRPEQFFRDLSTVGNKLTKINLNHNMQLGSVELSDMIEALNKMDDIRIHSLFFDRWISSRWFAIPRPLMIITIRYHRNPITNLNYIISFSSES
ncbi:Hypothetical protein NTJ_16340 [Nesidiocoris tenuis]|nr:Hypothetical protein NTJ_16340 [Nesidiocoris tenuis]